MEEPLGDGDLRRPAVEAHGEVVDLLDGVRVPEARRLLGVALVVLLPGVVLLEDEPLHQAEHRGAGLRVEHALDVPDGVVRRELPAAVPLDVLAEAERPGLEIRARLPLLAEHGPRDVVGAGHRQVVADLADRVRPLHPAEGVRVLHVLAAHAEAERPALRHRALRPRLADEPLARDRADGPVGRRRRHAEERRVPEELPAIDLALGQLALEEGDGGMFPAVCHRRILPSAVGS